MPWPIDLDSFEVISNLACFKVNTCIDFCLLSNLINNVCLPIPHAFILFNPLHHAFILQYFGSSFYSSDSSSTNAIELQYLGGSICFDLNFNSRATLQLRRFREHLLLKFLNLSALVWIYLLRYALIGEKGEFSCVHIIMLLGNALVL